MRLSFSQLQAEIETSGVKVTVLTRVVTMARQWQRERKEGARLVDGVGPEALHSSFDDD